MVGQIAGVVLGAVDEARFATPQHVQPDPIQAGSFRDHSRVVSQTSFSIENAGVEPRIVGTKAGRPDDRRDPAIPQIQAEGWRLLDSGRGESMRCLDLTFHPVLQHPVVDSAEEAVHLEVGQIAQVAQGAGQLGLPVDDPGHATDQSNSLVGQGIEVERPPLRCPDQLR